MITKFVSDIRGLCPQCGEDDALFFDDNGELLCGDCIFENEISAQQNGRTEFLCDEIFEDYDAADIWGYE